MHGEPMKTLGTIVLLLCLAGLIYAADQSSGFLQTTFPESRMNDLQDILVSFTALVPTQSLQDYGFANIRELNEAKPGIPLKLFELDPQIALGFKPKGTVLDILTPTREWFVPVHTSSGIRAMLRLAEDRKGGFIGVSFGYVPLARGFEQAALDTRIEDKGPAVLVISYQANEFFLAFPGQEAEILYPLSSEFNVKYGIDVYTQIQRIIPSIMNNLQQGY